MVPLLIGGGIAAGSALVKGVRAAKQKKEANRLNPMRPEMTRTKGSVESENRARAMANSSRLPGQSYYENQIGSQTARSANAAMQTGGSTGEVIAGLSQADRNAKDQLAGLGVSGAQFKAQNEGMLQNALQSKSAEEMEMFDYNRNQPYQTTMLRKQALIDSSNRNIEGAIEDIGNFGTGLAQGMGFGSSTQRSGVSGPFSMTPRTIKRKPISTYGNSGIGLTGY